MEKDQLSRRLAVLLHADVVGSTSLVQKDEALAHERIQDTFRRFSETIRSYGGVALEIRGDALLADFSKASDSVSASLAFQAANTTFYEQLSDDIRPVLRIGIAMGEVVVADNTVTGEGVVLAQRLEQLAEPGGVCIQDAAYQTIPKRLPFKCKNLGDCELKGFDEPVRAFSVELKSGADIPQFEAQASRALAAPTLPDKPSIAVLPFDNMSSDPDHASFADGLTENTITALSRFGGLFVIARHSSFQYKGKSPDIREVGRDLGVRYVLEGSVQKSKDTVRVTAQLIDAATTGHVWADQFDRPVDDLFKVQDEITEHIVNVIAPVSAGTGKLQKVELERIARTPTESLQAYDYFLRGMTHYNRFNENDNRIARQMFEKAVEIDPNYARATARTAWTYIQDYQNEWGESPEDSLSKAVELAQAAIVSDPNEVWAHRSKASALLFQKRHDEAIQAFQRALEPIPNEPDLLIEYGWTLAYVGRPEDGIPIMESAVRLNPYHPAWYLWDLAWGYFVARRYHEAIAALQKRDPKTNFTYLLLAACYVQVDQVEEAAKAMKKFRELEPNFSIELAAKAEPFKYPQDLEHWLEAIRKAGLPEAPDSAPPDPS